MPRECVAAQPSWVSPTLAVGDRQDIWHEVLESGTNDDQRPK